MRHGPKPLNPNVTRTMKRVRRRDAKPEMQLRKELHRRGLRFRVDYGGLPGHPDICLTRARIAVFVDRCFWHGCELHGSLPEHNRDWWEAKLARNRERDVEVTDKLRDWGWVVLRNWTHDDVEEMADEIEDVWRELRGLEPIPRE